MTANRSPEARERQREQIKKSSAARSVANRVLRERYRAEWDEIYEAEARANGVTPLVDIRAARIAKLRAELEWLES